MPSPFWDFFNSFITGGERAILNQTSCEVKIDHGEEEEKEHQNGMERGVSYYLPEELVMESILTRLPVRSLPSCCFVSKLWYNSILNDSRFAVIHNIQNKNKLSLVFSLLNVSRKGMEGIYFFSLLGPENVDIDILCDLGTQNIYEMVGFCNGLACIKVVSEPDYALLGTISVVNPNWGETLCLSYLPPTRGYTYLCHGFGFDSISQVYKAVMVFKSEANDKYLCMVITLGTMSWRKIVTSTSDISPPPGSSRFPSKMVTRVSRTLYRQATFCAGDLFWRTKNKVSDSDDIEMLLSFDLHNEKIHFIQLPTACTLTTPLYEHQYLAVDYLLEFKGYPCIAHSERITTRSNNDHFGHRCNYQTGVCCCCYKVHMYILKDKDKQVWTREETFDVQIKDREGLLPGPLCCSFKRKTPFSWCFDTSAATPPTRILTLFDQVLLYWFNGERLIFYNLQEKRLKVVECSRYCPRIFQSKMNENLERRVGDDDNIYCPSMDYQLHAQVENIVSLETFIPKEAKTSVCDSDDDLRRLFDNNLVTGWLTTGRREHSIYAFC